MDWLPAIRRKNRIIKFNIACCENRNITQMDDIAIANMGFKFAEELVRFVLKVKVSFGSEADISQG
jgi:hypothetical protein